MKKTTPTSILVLLAALALPAEAQLYAGGAFGQSRSKLEAADRTDQLFGLGFDGASTRADDRDTAYRLFMGYRLHRYLASEIGYTDLGRSALVSDVLPGGTLESRTRVRGADLSLLGLLPLGERFAVFARGGLFEGRARTNFLGSGSVRLLDPAESSKRRASGLFGAGVMAQLSPRWDVRADWTRFRRVGDDGVGGRFDIDAWMVGAAYRF